jgi:hypothetical protein
MDLIPEVAQYPVQTVALAFTSIAVVVLLLIAHRTIRRRVWIEVIVWWYLVAGIAISWQYLVRIVGKGAVPATPPAHLVPLIVIDLVLFHFWPLIWGFGVLWFANDQAFAARLLQEVITSVCAGIMISVSVVRLLQFWDGRSAAGQKGLDQR